MANSYVSKDKLIMNGIVAMAMRFVGLAISFFLIPIFIRKMGAELYGIWLLPNIALGQIGFVDLGFTAGVSRNIAVCYAQRNYEELSQSIWTGIFILAVIGLLGGGFFIFGQGQIAHWFHIKETDMQMASSLFRLVGIGLIIQWPLKILGTILHAGMFDRYVSPLGTFCSLFTNACYIILLSLGMTSLVIFQLISLLFNLAISAICFYYVRKFMPEVRLYSPKMPWIVLKKVAPYSFGVFYNRVLSYMAIGIDSFLLGIFQGVSAISIYQVITKFFILVQSYTFTIMGNFNIAVVHLDATNEHDRMERLFCQSVMTRLFIVCSMVFPIIIILPHFVRLWVGDEFSKYVFWGQLYLVVPVYSCLGQASNFMRGCGRLKFVNAISTWTCCFNFIVSFFAVQYMGVGGVILGTILAHLLFGDPFTFPFICRFLKFDWRPPMFAFFKTIIINLAILGMLYPLFQLFSLKWVWVISSGIFLGICFVLLNWYTTLSHELRVSLYEFVRRKLWIIKPVLTFK